MTICGGPRNSATLPVNSGNWRGKVHSPDARRDLLELAERFDRMAARIDPDDPAEI